MANQNLNVIIKLIDEISGPIKKASASIQQVGRDITALGNNIGRVGQKMAFLGTFISAPFIAAAKAAAAYSEPVNKTLNEIANSFAQLYTQVGESILPVMRQLGNLLSNVVEWFKKLNPQVRDAVLQWTLIGGIVLMAGGIFLKVVSSMITIVGKLLQAMNPVTITIALIAAATVLLIQNWDKVRGFVMPVLRALQIAVDMVAIGYEKMALAMTHVLAFGAAMAGKQNLAVYFEEQAIKIEQTIQSLEDNMADAMSGKGLAEGLDNSIKNIQGFWAQVQTFFNKGVQSAKNQLFRLGDYTKQIATQMAQAMEQHLGNFFYKVLTGQLKDAREAFADFGRAILQILTQAIAKLLLFYTIGRMVSPMLGFNPFQFHQGGVVKRAHSGAMLSSDEVPIVAQAGEGIISRRGMNALGKGNFDRINRGDGGSGGKSTIVIYQAIQAWDFKDVYRNKRTLAQGIIEEMRKNGDFRTAIREYA
jgi:hypothetical protein